MRPFHPCHHRPSRRPIAGRILLGILIGLVAAGVLGTVVMLLWNHVLHALFPVPAVTWCQAVGLFLLTRVLFGGFHGGHRHWRRGGPWQHPCHRPEEEGAPSAGGAD